MKVEYNPNDNDEIVRPSVCTDTSVDDTTPRIVRTNDLILKLNSDGDVVERYLSDLQKSSFMKVILYRLIKNRDCKILISSSGNTTGTGKTTLAVILSRIIDRFSSELLGKPQGWSAEDFAFTSGYEYVNKYKDGDEGDVLITDEMEVMLDNRRSMSKSNVEVTQRLQTMRFKNIVTIATLPGIWSVDKRVLHNFDLWINVTQQGRANIYLISVNDFTGQLEYKRLRVDGIRESLVWLPLINDNDKNHLDELKENVHEDEDGFGDNETNLRDNLIKNKKINAVELLILNDINDMGMTQSDIAKLIPSEENDKEHMSQQWISRVKKEFKEEGIWEEIENEIKDRLD